MDTNITILSNNEDVKAFRAKEPNGYTILDGDSGVGLTGELAEQARNISGDPMSWIAIAERIGPAIHAAKRNGLIE